MLIHGGQQLVYTEHLFISDYFFTTIYPGITPTCGSQACIHLQKFRFIILTLQDTCTQSSITAQHQLFPLQSCTLAGSLFLCTYTLSRCLKPWVCFPFTMYRYHRFQFPSAQKKAFDRCIQLGRGITAVYHGLRMIECVLTPVRTDTGTNPDGPRTSQVLQNLKQFNPTLGKSPHLEDSQRDETLLRDRVEFLT